MKIYLTAAALLFFLLSSTSFCQMENQIWKPLYNNAKEKIWYDESFLDTLHSEIFNVWILHMYNPPLVFEEINGRIYRTKIQYAVNLKMMKYGMLKAVYFGINNKMICDFDYPINSYADSLKFTYPVNDNHALTKVMEVIKKKYSGKSSVKE